MEEKKSELVKVDKPKKSFKETITLMIRKKWLSSTSQTFLLVAVLIAVFIAVNLYVQNLDMETIDVTKNKIYTLSDSSKDVIKNINKDVTIYLYGITEDSSLADFVKQYSRANEHIKWEILTEESNLAKVQEFELKSGYQIIVMECEGASKIIDTSYELNSYDYMTGQSVDLTEQTLTNSLLAITTDNKPKVYFTTGHEEYSLESELGVLATYLKNEAYDASSVNLLTEGKVPDDCDLLVIMAPVKDFMEQEVESILAYIKKGGNIIVTSDVGNLAETYPNLQRICDQYGVSLNHTGYVYETDSTYAHSNYPNIFIPQISPSNDITSSMYSDGKGLWLVNAGRLNFVSDEELQNLNVTRDDILYSSDKALFIADLTKSASEVANSAEEGKSIIASVMSKTIKTVENATTEAEGTTEGENAGDNEVEQADAITENSEASEESTSEKEEIVSTAVFIANAKFITDYKIEQLSQSYPISYIANNKDFMLNSIGNLTKKENTLTIRKGRSSSTYSPTEQQNNIVLAIIFLVPVAIIVLGIVVWNLRRRKR